MNVLHFISSFFEHTNSAGACENGRLLVAEQYEQISRICEMSWRIMSDCCKETQENVLDGFTPIER